MGCGEVVWVDLLQGEKYQWKVIKQEISLLSKQASKQTSKQTASKQASKQVKSKQATSKQASKV
ncbi:hypothetical protein INT82_02380 [Mannheimia haemolytica]|nr:hypothetical protein [Mannheimia haemolytica]